MKGYTEGEMETPSVCSGDDDVRASEGRRLHWEVVSSICGGTQGVNSWQGS